MNIYSILGFGIAIGVLMIGFRLATSNPSMFVDYPSMFIVVGGTLASTAISFQLNRITVLFKIFFRRMLKGKKQDYAKVISEIMKISDAYRKGEALDAHISKISDPFLKEGLNMINDGVLEENHIIRLMRDRCENMLYNHMQEASKIKTMAKFPPAFGMIGTTTGMVVLLSNLGGEDAMKMIGPAMSVCIITTLYGTVIAYISLIPISENLTDDSKEIYLKNKIIVEGLKLLVKKTNPIVVAEELNSFLAPGDRLDWKQIIGK